MLRRFPIFIDSLHEIYFFFSGIGLILTYVLHDLPALSERREIGDAAEFPLFFGTTLFAIEAVGVVVALENNMKTPKSFGSTFGVLNVGMVVITLLYAAFGFLGYLKYGIYWTFSKLMKAWYSPTGLFVGAGSADSITLNLPSSDM